MSRVAATYIVTLSGATDVDGGMDSTMDVVVHDSCSGNINATATLVDSNVPGVYTFQVTIPQGECSCTMPIEYFTRDSAGAPAFLPGTGFFAQGYDGTGGDGKSGHLRNSTFDGSCNVNNPPCAAPSATPTPTPCTGQITACKFYDFNANGKKDTGEVLLAWPFCLTGQSDTTFSPVTATSSDGSCAVFSNLPLGTYLVTEGTAAGYTSTTIVGSITLSQCNQNAEVDFGNFCTVPSGGLTLGYWSNKNGNKVLTGNTAGTGTTLLGAVTSLLNSPCGGGAVLRNANGTIHTFTGTYADLKTWLLGANATNMAYTLSAQTATLLLDTHYGATIGSLPAVDGNAFDLCSNMTVTSLIGAACDSLTGPGNQLTLSGNPSRPGQEMLKNCIDAINNNGGVIPVAPCPFTFPNPPAPCP